MQRKIKYYVEENGKSPFEVWFLQLDKTVKVLVARAIQKVAQGRGKGSIKSLKDGVFEIRIFYGAGYRVYFAEKENELIILLVGGDKSTQEKDMIKAKKYWRLYGK